MLLMGLGKSRKTRTWGWGCSVIAAAWAAGKLKEKQHLLAKAPGEDFAGVPRVPVQPLAVFWVTSVFVWVYFYFFFYTKGHLAKLACLRSSEGDDRCRVEGCLITSCSLGAERHAEHFFFYCFSLGVAARLLSPWGGEGWGCSRNLGFCCGAEAWAGGTGHP